MAQSSDKVQEEDDADNHVRSSDQIKPSCRLSVLHNGPAVITTLAGLGEIDSQNKFWYIAYAPEVILCIAEQYETLLTYSSPKTRQA